MDNVLAVAGAPVQPHRDPAGRALDDHYLARDRPLGEARVLWEIGADGLRRPRSARPARPRLRLPQPAAAGARGRWSGHRRDRRRRPAGARARLTAAGAPSARLLDERSDDLARSILGPADAASGSVWSRRWARSSGCSPPALVGRRRGRPRRPGVPGLPARAYFAELDLRFDAGFDRPSPRPATTSCARPAACFLVASLRRRAGRLRRTRSSTATSRPRSSGCGWRRRRGAWASAAGCSPSWRPRGRRWRPPRAPRHERHPDRGDRDVPVGRLPRGRARSTTSPMPPLVREAAALTASPAGGRGRRRPSVPASHAASARRTGWRRATAPNHAIAPAAAPATTLAKPSSATTMASAAAPAVAAAAALAATSPTARSTGASNRPTSTRAGTPATSCAAMFAPAAPVAPNAGTRATASPMSTTVATSPTATRKRTRPRPKSVARGGGQERQDRHRHREDEQHRPDVGVRLAVHGPHQRRAQRRHRHRRRRGDQEEEPRHPPEAAPHAVEVAGSDERRHRGRDHGGDGVDHSGQSPHGRERDRVPRDLVAARHPLQDEQLRAPPDHQLDADDDGRHAGHPQEHAADLRRQARRDDTIGVGAQPADHAVGENGGPRQVDGDDCGLDGDDGRDPAALMEHEPRR